MPKLDGLVFALAGFLVWLVVSGFYAAFGGGLIEISVWYYVFNAILGAGAAVTAYDILIEIRRAEARPAALALAFTAPSLVCLVVLLGGFGAHVDHPFRYGLFLAFSQLMVIVAAFDPNGPRQPAR